MRLEDILGAAKLSRALVADLSFDAYLADTVKRLAVERCLEIVSEASRYMPEELKAQEPEIPWRKVANIGNVLRHGYQSLDDLQIYNVVRDEVPLLEAAIERLLPSAPD